MSRFRLIVWTWVRAPAAPLIINFFIKQKQKTTKMKKAILAVFALVAITLVSCGTGTTETPANTDSTVVADSATMQVDSTATAVDTTATH